MTVRVGRSGRGRFRRVLALVPVLAMSALPVAILATTEGVAASTVTVVNAPGAGPDAKIRVSKTNALRNESVEVSWSGFKPSSATQLNNSGNSYDTVTENPVRVYECRGVGASLSSSDCYGSPGFRGIPAIGGNPAVPPVPGYTYPGQTDPYANSPDGPSNFQDTVTAADGTGRITIQLFTRLESTSLGCDQDSACSIVVVPNYGRPNGATEDQLDAPWAWDRRTVIPLHFASIEVSCPLGADGLPVEGSPMSMRLLASWRARTCVDKHTMVNLDYTMVGEEQARSDVVSGMADVGLVSSPVDTKSADGVELVQAPVSVSGIAIGFQVDDAQGQQISHMKLNARLVAKLITASYRVADDPHVEGNPSNIFLDKEFLALNPGVDWPSGAPGNHVLLLGDLSDMTVALTSWIDSDPEARSFLNGKPDPYGMHVNTAYKKIDLPFAAFPLLDQKQSDLFEPIQGLDHVSRQLSLAQFPGAIVEYEDGLPVISKPPRQNPGRREVIGIIDAADADSFRLSIADLQNSGGAFVGPDHDGLAAGVGAIPKGEAFVSAKDHNKQVYPLTMLTSVVARLDATKDVRAAAARFLEFAAGPGQVPGTGAGDLPDGHLPLPNDLRKQALAAATALRAGVDDSDDDDDNDNNGNNSAGPNNSGDSPANIDGSGSDPANTPKGEDTPNASVNSTPAAFSVAEPWTSSVWLPIALVVGLVALVGGGLVAAAASRGIGPAWLRR